MRLCSTCLHCSVHALMSLGIQWSYFMLELSYLTPRTLYLPLYLPYAPNTTHNNTALSHNLFFAASHGIIHIQHTVVTYAPQDRGQYRHSE